jgi:Ca-activated chloride channel family protein
VPDDLRVGIVAFNHTPTVLQSPTRDRAAAREALAGVRAAGSTATGDALAAALRLARTTQNRRAPAAIVLLSDGKSVRGRDALAVAGEARAARIPVYTVALGTASGTIEGSDGTSQAVPPDPDTLRRIAERTGGRAYAIADADRLAEVYERLGTELATEKRTEEVTSVAAGLGLVLLLVGIAAPLRWFGRLA